MPATVFWVGLAPLQRNTLLFTCSAPTLGATRYVEYNGRRVTVIASDTSAATLAGQLYAAIRSSTDPYIKDGNVSLSGDTFTVTGPADGAPLTSPGVSTGVTLTTNTAGTGPYHADNVLNYSSGALPANGDTLIFQYGVKDFSGPRYGLTALTSITLAVFRVMGTFLGNVGLPRNRGPYTEHRPRYLESKATAFEIYSSQADDDERFKVTATKAGATSWLLSGGGTRGTYGVPIEVTGLLSTSTITASNTGVSVSPEAAAASVLDSIVGNNANVTLSDGVTVSVGLTLTGGVLNSAVDVVAAALRNTTAVFTEAGRASGTLTVNGGTVDHRSSANPGTVKVYEQGAVDFSAAAAILTPGAAFSMSAGSRLTDGGRLAAGYQVTPVGCSIQDLILDLPVGRYGVFT